MLRSTCEFEISRVSGLGGRPMSWLGKILTFLVLIGACVWAFFTIQAFVTRTNWQARAAELEKRLKESEDARQKEYRESQSNQDALVRLYKAEKSLSDDL